MRPDDELLTPNRHCFGGQEDHGKAFSNEFLLGVSFAAGFEGSALNDHLNVHAGLEITGNSNDVQVAGEPSLVITPNTFGDWPPLKRVQGDVNAFCKAKLDAYITEIEKSWSVNLARIDYEYTTESILTMTDISVDIVEKDISSTEFLGTRPNVVRNIPKGSSFAAQKNVLVFGMYNSSTKQTDLVLSMADGDEFAIPSTIVPNVEGLGLVLLEPIGGNKYLLIWEEHPGITSNPKAYSVIKSSLYDGSWNPVKVVDELNSYLNDMKLFITSENISLIYFASPESDESNFNKICAVPYTSSTDSWNDRELLQLVSEKVDYDAACVGGTSVEPGQILYINEAGEMFSMYWDGFKTHISGGNELCNITSNSSNVAICSGGTNEILYVTSCGLNDIVNLHAYIPDPNREPSDPSYDWYGRESTNIWPYLGPLTTVDDNIYDLENCYLPDCSTLLSVWSKSGSLYGNWVSPLNLSSTTNITITTSSNGDYKDIKIIPISNNTARVTACYVDETSYDIRIFNVNAFATSLSDDADGDGIPDYMEQQIVDADPDDDINDIRDVHGDDDFDGDGFSNAEEWANNTRADLADSYPQFGAWVETVVPCAEESSLAAAIFTINRGNDDSGENPITVNYNLDGSATFGTDYNALSLNVLIPTGQYSADVVIQPIMDNLAEGTEDVIITLNTGAGYVLGSDTQAVIRILDTPKGKWKHKYFSQIQLDDPNIIGDDKDPDNDGIPNYLEMALGLDPLSPDICQLEMVLNEDNIQFKYTRDPEVESALIKIISTTNLVVQDSWDQAAAQCIWRESRADGLEDVYYQEPTNSPSGYYRLRAEKEQ
jgi:hypothetical protein